MTETHRFRNQALSILAIAALSACDSGGNSGNTVSDDASEITTLEWTPCDEDARLECANLEVPMVHAAPDGEKITIALNRLPTTSDSRKGSLLFNPGGPGGSGFRLLLEFVDSDIVPEEVRNAYDLIGFDPRGVNKSTPVDCEEFFNEDIIDYPLNFSELQSIESDNAEYINQCVEKYGSYLQNLGSADVVDDMELVRQSFGEPKLNFIGYSYGTRLAALYAQTYPTTTGHMVLDASLPPTHANIELFEGQLVPHENNLELFASLCESHSNCEATAYKQQIVDHVNNLISEGEESELDIVGTIILTAIQEPQIASELTVPFYEYMQTNNMTALIEIAEAIDDTEEGNYDETTTQRAVICSDDAARHTIEEIEALRPQFNEKSDLIAELQLASVAYCLDWPQANRPLPRISTDTAPELLVIAGPTDSQTPANWGESMAQAIGARYLLSEHLGHTVVFNGENPCVDEVVIDYLVNDILPDKENCPIPD